MAGLLDNSMVGINCPECGHKTNKSIGWVKNNKGFTCACGTNILLEDSAFKTKIDELDRSFTEFQNALKNLTKENFHP